MGEPITLDVFAHNTGGAPFEFLTCPSGIQIKLTSANSDQDDTGQFLATRQRNAPVTCYWKHSSYFLTVQLPHHPQQQREAS